MLVQLTPVFQTGRIFKRVVISRKEEYVYKGMIKSGFKKYQMLLFLYLPRTLYFKGRNKE